jgi:predicted phage terminase large subunit-like protein
MTRWNVNDLTGKLLKDAARDPKADQWEVIELPAILPSGKPLWPEYWKLEELESVKASLRGGPKWHAQYMQNPSSEEGALIKREWWMEWPNKEPPDCEYLIQSYDTAFLKSQMADYSAITTWGVFYPNGRLGGDEIYNGDAPHIILLDVVKGKYNFPELKALALKQYEHWEPDVVIIEGKASGVPLTQELRNIGIPVQNFTPSRGNDKIARVNATAPLFESGMVWHPDSKWSHDVIEECAAFPAGDHDDLVDSTTQALLRFRQGGFIRLPSDYEEEVLYRKKMSYY